jgi:hypothetical protein
VLRLKFMICSLQRNGCHDTTGDGYLEMPLLDSRSDLSLSHKQWLTLYSHN